MAGFAVQLEGRRALITGAARGIGAACAARFVAEGASVTLADLPDSQGAETAARIGANACFVSLDVTDEKAWIALAGELDKQGHLDILVNNAGISGLRHIEEADFAWWRRFQSNNSDSIFLGIHHMLPLLKRGRSAAIVNIGSTLALRASPDLPAYGASKAALRMLTKSVALHCAREGYDIRCNAVHPGSTATDMMNANLGDSDELREAATARRMAAHPLAKARGRMIAPEDIAAAVLFLASDESLFITGIDLPVDGGFTA